MKPEKTVWRLWWGWNPETIENWLEDMEKKGWNLVKVDFASIRFTFALGEARQSRYCTDYQAKVDKSYFDLFEDAGWELVWQGAMGWYIWRKPYDTERPGIYTDNASLVGRNKRLMAIGAAFFVLTIIYALYALLLFTRGASTARLAIPLTFTVIMLISLGYGTWQLNRYTQKLTQNRIRE